ncbi:MAG TPA: lasso peptide biosynthesis B2 protein [Sphingomicrobium sp.]
MVQGRPVFLDVRDDSYFLLEPPHEQQFLELVAKPAGVMNAGHSLRAALGLPEGSKLPRLAQCPAATRGIYDGSERLPRTRILDVISLWRTLVRVRRALKTLALETILSDVTTDGTDRADASESVAERATCFAAARKAIAIAPNCLLDSLALLEWLGPSRGAASLVFAVKLDPFAAHCWIQSNDLLLNDRLDEIARFHPVRVVTCSRATR